MKSLSIIGFLVVGLLSVRTYAGELPEGKYIFSAPALFGSVEGEVCGKLCELEATEKGYQLIFLNNPLSRGSRITFSVTNGRIVFDESHMPSSEIGRTITGKGNLQDDAIASGKLTISMGSVGFLLAKRKASEWSLRPATRSEVLESYAEGLTKAEDFIWGRRGREKPTDENAIKALYSVVGFGFTRKDVPELKKMLESGDLNYRDGKFSFRQNSPDDSVLSSLPISTNVTTEDIDLRGKIAGVTDATMQVVQETDAAGSIPTPSVVATPKSSKFFLEKSPQQVDIEPVSEMQKLEEGSNRVLLGLISLGVFIFLLFTIIKSSYYRKKG
jgi:hypothetical protein